MQSYTENEISEFNRYDQLKSRAVARLLSGFFLMGSSTMIYILLKPQILIAIPLFAFCAIGLWASFSALKIGYEVNCFRCPRCKESFLKPIRARFEYVDRNHCFSCGMKRPPQKNWFKP